MNRVSSGRKDNNKHGTHLFTAPFMRACSFRLMNAFVLSTFCSADEYYQSIEPAHFLVFDGVGLLTWEFSTQWRLRSIAYPLLAYAVPFKFLKALEIDTAWSVDAVVRVVGCVQSALSDVGIYRLSRKWSSNDRAIAEGSFMASLLSHWRFYLGTRAFANCLEETFVVWALVYWPSGYSSRSNKIDDDDDDDDDELCDGNDDVAKTAAKTTRRNNRSNNRSKKSNNKYKRGFRVRSVYALVLAFMSCVVRPTAYAFWLIVGLYTVLFDSKNLSSKTRAQFALDASIVGSLVLTAEALVNRSFYNAWVFPPWNFFKFNVLNDGASQYGENSLFWAITQGLPTTLGVLFPVTLYQLFITTNNNKTATAVPTIAKVAFLATVGIVSIPKHKEFRFLNPLVPIAFAVSAKWLVESNNNYNIKNIVIIGLLLQIPLALYLSLFHQRGMEAIVRKHVSRLGEEDVFDGGVHFWTPCHEHPYLATLHKNLTTSYLECNPRPMRSNSMTSTTTTTSKTIERQHKSQWKSFEENPSLFVKRRYGHTFLNCFAKDTREDLHSKQNKEQIPSHVVIFQRERDEIIDWLKAFHFKEIANEFHAHFSVDREGQSRAYLFAREIRTNDDRTCSSLEHEVETI